MPSLNTIKGRESFIAYNGFDENLLSRINFDLSKMDFFTNVVLDLFAYQTMNDGRDPVKSLLISSKERCGQEGRQRANFLLQQLEEYHQNHKEKNGGLFHYKKNETGEPSKLSIRNKPIMVSKEEYKKVFKLNKHYEPCDYIYIQNDFRNRGDVIIDYTTGLTWQTLSSDEIECQDIQPYIGKLNVERFAGFYDWRLPTIPELISLIEPKKQANCLCLDVCFKTHEEEWCWSADIRPERTGACLSNWYVYFNDGSVFWSTPGHKRRIRAVRTGINL